MRLFLITNSSKFTGTAQVLYNEKDILCRIDVTDTNMDAATVKHFKAAVPPDISTLVSGQSFGAGTTVVEDDFAIDFDMFWKKYKKKINRKRAELVWHKLNKADQVAAYYGIDAYFKYLKREHWRGQLDPENYLKNRHWENEY